MAQRIVNMTFEKQIIVDLIEIIENGSVQIRTKTTILEDGIELTSTFHRNIIVPGNNYNQENAKVQAICAAVHTPEVIAAYQETQIQA